MEQTWPNFPMCWTTLVEMQKIRSMVNLHPWTSVPRWPPGLQALLLLSWAVHPHLCLLPTPLDCYPKVPCVPAHGRRMELDGLKFLPGHSVVLWWALSLVLLGSGMGSATRKRIQDKLGYRCFIQAASYSVSLQLALSNSLHLCTHLSKFVSVINTWYAA